MKRAFSFLAFFALNIVIIASACVYWFAAEDISHSKREITVALAKGVALGISSKIDQLNLTLDRMANDPDLITAVENGNVEHVQAILTRFQSLLPGALKLRFLLPDTVRLDKSETPHLGYADLELIRATFKRNQPPLIQGTKGPQRHLAIARKTQLTNQTAAVLLASLDYDFLNKTVIAAKLREGLLELTQDKLVMATSGNKAMSDATDTDRVQVVGTSWTIVYQYPKSHVFGQVYSLTGIIVALCLVLLLGFFVAFRKVLALLQLDQNSVLMAVKDMVNGQPHSSYPAELDETKLIISSIRQYKRLMEQQDNEAEAPAPEPKNGLDLDNLFDEEPENPDLEISQGTDNDTAEFDIIDPETNTPITVKASNKPIIMPDDPDLQPVSVGVPEKSIVDIIAGDDIFRAYDIRGSVGKSLDKDFVYKLGCALGSEVSETGHKTLVVARDGRNSSPALYESLTNGVLSTGTHIIDLGQVPTSVLYFVVHHHADHSGVMITGGHSASEYNGFKMVINGQTITQKNINKIKQRIEENNFVSADAGNLTPNQLFSNEYIGAISDEVHLARPMKVVVDCGNGVAGEILPTLLKTVGCEVIELFCDIDGDFPNHHPNPSHPDNVKDLEAAVKYYQADLGLAFSGDGGRLGVLDSATKIIWPDRLMMLFAKEVLKKNPATDIIYDVKSTHLLTEYIVKSGGNPVMCKTGYPLIKEKLIETKAKLAGEMSGHFFFNDRWFGFDDGLFAACRLIEILSADTRTSQEVFAELPDSVNTAELIVPVNEGENGLIVEKFIQAANFEGGHNNTLDGLRVDFSDGWGLLRASNTGPSLVLRFDADNKSALSRIQEQFKSLLLEIKADLVLPF